MKNSTMKGLLSIPEKFGLEIANEAMSKFVRRENDINESLLVMDKFHSCVTLLNFHDPVKHSIMLYHYNWPFVEDPDPDTTTKAYVALASKYDPEIFSSGFVVIPNPRTQEYYVRGVRIKYLHERGFYGRFDFLGDVKDMDFSMKRYVGDLFNELLESLRAN